MEGEGGEPGFDLSEVIREKSQQLIGGPARF